uniref:Uncharacterized protein n=1 Tax=Panagrolaimus davidi TaxID=227884 RepID=A0A914P881_9BILA
MNSCDSTEPTKEDVKKIASSLKIPKSPPSSNFPFDVLKYMKENANPKQAVELMRVNKYFLQREFRFKDYGKLTVVDNMFHVYTWDDRNVAITGELRIKDSYGYYFFYRLVCNTVLCDLRCLVLNIRYMDYEDFKFLTSSGNLKDLSMKGLSKIRNNGKIVPSEIILDHTPLLRKLTIIDVATSIMSSKFVEKILESDLQRLVLFRFPKAFDFELMLTSLRKKPTLCIILFFDKHYRRNKVNAYIDKLIAENVTDSLTPYFETPCSEISEIRKKALDKLRSNFLQHHPDSVFRNIQHSTLLKETKQEIEDQYY